MKWISLLFIVLSINLSGQEYWTPTKISQQSQRSDDAMYLPKKYHGTVLNFEAIKQHLSQAEEGSMYSKGAIKVSLPLPNGDLMTFNTVLSPVMEQELADKYPSIKTFKGISLDGKSIARFGYGPSGFHASIRTYQGEIYIDQVSKTTGQEYVSYYVKDHNEPVDGHLLSCGTDEGHQVDEIRNPVGAANRGEAVELHVYQFALACTGVWGRPRGTVEKALEDMVTSTNRLNQIYENEAAMRLVLIGENDKLIELDPNATSYSQVNVGRALLVQNTSVINSKIGNANKYDLGHVYTNNCTDVGGVAFLGSMCSGNKGAGVTCHYTNLIYITVQVAAHEIGHQLSAQHTFNNCSDASGDNSNASPGNDFEPGSGSTIMSYGGLCGSNNVQGNNDDYYNNGSLVQIYDHTRRSGGGAYGCAERVPTNNISPDVNIPLEDGFYIPASTYFVLTGEAEDANGDEMSYSWEQKDAGVSTCVYGTPTGSCPLFRSLPAKDVPYRFFPRENRILSGTSDISEILPTYDRKLTFSFTARDNNEEAGIAVWKNIQFNVDASAGPFKVLTPTIGDEYEVGQKVPVTWDVANTDNALINCQSVDIYLSLKKALHKSDENLILLESAVPNNGYAEVYLPDVDPTIEARILIMASNNIFFDITDFFFRIKEASEPRALYSLVSNREQVCLPGSTTIDLKTEAFLGFDGEIAFDVVDLPSEVTASFENSSVKAGASNKVTFNIANELKTGEYEWAIRGIVSNGDTIIRRFFAEVVSTDFSDLLAVSPSDGEKDSPGLPTFKWSNSFNATEYTFELADKANFEASSILYTSTGADTSFTVTEFLPKGDVFYWRIKAANGCGEGAYTNTRAIGTINESCKIYDVLNGLPTNISATGTNEYKVSLPIFDSGSISDFNITKVKMTHNFFKDLSATIKSPKGTEVLIWSNACANKYDMDVRFDDDANAFFNCANGVTLFRPMGKFSSFDGEDPQGTWELVIKDNQSGNGGKIEEVSIEVCGTIESNPPILVRNEILQMQPLRSPRVSPEYLLVEDADDAPNAIRYNIVKTPQHGQLLHYGVPMQEGDWFTQEDLDLARVFYSNTEDADEDAFYFLVEDAKGGWIEITRFSIEISNDFPSSTIDILDSHIGVKPNPAYNHVDITLAEGAGSLHTLIINDISGKAIQSYKLTEGGQRIDISNLNAGLYILSFTNGQKSVNKKLVVGHR